MEPLRILTAFCMLMIAACTTYHIGFTIEISPETAETNEECEATIHLDDNTNSPSYMNWNWGDGTTEYGTDFQRTHQWTEPGTYTVSVTAFCNNGGDPSVKCAEKTLTKTQTIQVKPRSQKHVGTYNMTAHISTSTCLIDTTYNYSLQSYANGNTGLLLQFQNFFGLGDNASATITNTSPEYVAVTNTPVQLNGTSYYLSDVTYTLQQNSLHLTGYLSGTNPPCTFYITANGTKP